MRVVRILLFLLCGIGLFAMGLDGWLDGSLMWKPKQGSPYLVARSGPHALHFYLHTFGLMGVGLLLCATMLLAGWRLLRAATPADLAGVDKMLPKSKSTRIPAWLFWLVAGGFTAFLVFAALNPRVH